MNCVNTQPQKYILLPFFLQQASIYVIFFFIIQIVLANFAPLMKHRHVLILILMFVGATLLGACSDSKRVAQVDMLNERSYDAHYRSLAQTRAYALQALKLSKGYDAGVAESYNNLAFVCLAKMNYGRAEEFLRYAAGVSDNLVEQLVAYVQFMRLCQRKSKNKDFYTYMQLASQLMSRIKTDEQTLNTHQHERFVYACSEFNIVASTYFYYVGLDKKGADQLLLIDPNGEVVKDTAQLLNYYYNIGSGGILRDGTAETICQEEFNYLMRCYLLSRQYNYPYWEANSLQGISEHLQNDKMRAMLLRNNVQEMEFVNVDKMADTLIAGNLALRALDLFSSYGDVYQKAGAYRTLAQCYFDIHDYSSALICLNNALATNRRVDRAPDLVASIREKLSMVYSALDNKAMSDLNRNLYLDLQEVTRQDRQLEARADQLDQTAAQLNLMIGAVGVVVLVLISLLVWLNHMRRKEGTRSLPDDVVEPLVLWKKAREDEQQACNERLEEIEEETAVARVQLDDNNRLNIEQRAKISLVGNIMPLIDRIAGEVDKLAQTEKAPSVNPLIESRYAYVMELAGKINEYNNALTQWIKLRRGDLTVRVESFRLQQLFDIIDKSRMEFNLKHISFEVVPTQAVVKADRTLTLFMLNTLTENARHFTPSGGHVRVEARITEEAVEISVSDSGCGMTQEQIDSLFNAKVIVDEQLGTTTTQSSAAVGIKKKSHGFGLINCKGIIEKYKKLSSIFSVCHIGVESTVGHGSRFFFSLPKGGVRKLYMIGLLLMLSTFGGSMECFAKTSQQQQQTALCLQKASSYADSAYYSNIASRYTQTMIYADSCRMWLNRYYLTLRPRGRQLITTTGDAKEAAEIKWFYTGLPCNYSIILDMRNESAVAALALHQWDTYAYNNKVYTQLFRDTSADNSLAQYVKLMQKSETNKNVAIIILSLLLVSIFPLYYFFYYRYRLRYRSAVERIEEIGKALLDNSKTAQQKGDAIKGLWKDLRNTAADDSQIEQLTEIVDQIETTLQADKSSGEDMQQKLSLAEDELQRLQYERDRLHVSNSVLDNSLSTLKHETMYYPCRIMQMVDSPSRDINVIRELVYYYRELFSILSEQAQRQTAPQVRFSYATAGYAISLLRKIVPQEQLSFDHQDIDRLYVRITTTLHTLKLSAQQIQELFTPSTADFRLLICRQIIRELGETTNARGCGIQAFAAPDGGTTIEITITQKIWKNLKLS